MPTYQPRKDRLGGLPNLSLIKRKPEPLGTEFKSVCDCETGVMTMLEIQEGKIAMQQATYARDFGFTLRLADSCKRGTCLMGDSWFRSVKVRASERARKR